MNLQKVKKQIVTKLSTIGNIFTLIAIKSNNAFATGIGTVEVKAATDNIQRVITSIAMPLGRNPYFCKYSSGSIKNDSKC